MDFVGQAKYLRAQLNKIGKLIELRSTRLSHKQLLDICATVSPSSACTFMFIVMYMINYIV